MSIDFNKLRTLTIKTDLIPLQFESSMSQVGSDVIIKTETRPDYFWGNYLITYSKIENKESLQKLVDKYSNSFQSSNDFKTIAFDIADGEIGKESIITEAGFKLYKYALLTTSEVNPPPKYNEEFEFREIDIVSELEELVEVHISDDWYLPKDQELPFLREKFKSLIKLEKAGIGKRFGAYINGKLVADLGIYSNGVLGRFNDVATHQDFRRRGLCGSLVYSASQYAFENMGITLLSMLADEEYHAAKIYESVGFKPTETVRLAEWLGKKYSLK